jgi:hypothetical protein
MIKIVREDMKPGKGAAHEKIESAFARAFQASKYPNYVGCERLTGPTQAWFLEGYANYAGIEAALKIASSEPLKSNLSQLDVQDGELRSGERTMIAQYMKDLSYTRNAFNLARMRFLFVNVIQVQRGHAQDFAEWSKIRSAAWEKVGDPGSGAMYRVSEGTVEPTYLMIWPMESLKYLDDETPWVNRTVMGESFERYRQLMRDALVSTEIILFAVNPKMSNPPKAYVEANPDFWAPKPKSAPAKEGTK